MDKISKGQPYTPHWTPFPPISKLKKSFIAKINLPFGLFRPISGVPLDAPTLKWRGVGKTGVWKILWFFCPSTVPCLGLSASKSQHLSNKSPNMGGALHACPPGLAFRAFWQCLFFVIMSLSILLSRPGWSNIFMHSLSPARFAAACPKASLWQLCCQGGPSHSCRCPGLGWETALEHIWSRRHCTRQLQDKYKTTTRQPTRRPTRQLQTLCKTNI